MITKSEVYSALIRIQKQSGQGLSGIVKIKSREYTQYLDELIQEGLVKACHTGGSIGHPESAIFYMPTKGYNVWEDDGVDGPNNSGTSYSQHKGRYLHYVRLYLGLVTLENKGPLEPGLLTYLQDPEVMKNYSEWLTRNNKALKEMLALDDFYQEKDVVLTSDEIKWVKARNWYEKNLTIAKCLNQSVEYIKNGSDEEMKSINKRLIELYKQSKPGKYDKELKEAQEEIENADIHMSYRKRVNSWLATQNQKNKIQSVI
jgi:hypothetical protein